MLSYYFLHLNIYLTFIDFFPKVFFVLYTKNAYKSNFKLKMNNCVCFHKFYVELKGQIPKKQNMFSLVCR